MSGIEIDSVSKRFEDTLVDSVSLTVKQGELIGLLGHNGAGKSTFTKMISGTLNPTSCTIKVGEYNIQKQPMKVKEPLA